MSFSWDIDNMEMMQDDCLHFLKDVFVGFYFNKFIKTCVYIALIFHVPLWAIQYYYFLSTMDISLFFQYGPTSLVMGYAFISTMVPIIKNDLIKDVTLRVKEICWSFDVADDITKRKLKRVAKYTTYSAKLSLVLGMITYTFMILRHRAHKQWELFYQVTFFREHFPDHASILIVFFYATIFIFTIPMMAVFYTLAYFTLHLYFQSALTLEKIKQVTESYPKNIQLFDDARYQQQVFHRLKFCVKRYTDLKSLALSCIGQLPIIMVVFVILSFTLIFSYVGTWYLDPDKYYPLVCMICIVSSQVGSVVAEIGQLTEEENVRLYETLIFLPWYTFNIRNQKIFLLFVGYTGKPITLCPYETFPINRRLLVQFYKVFTTTSAFLAHIKS